MAAVEVMEAPAPETVVLPFVLLPAARRARRRRRRRRRGAAGAAVDAADPGARRGGDECGDGGGRL